MAVDCVEGSRSRCLSTLLSEERGERTRPERRVTVGAPHFDSESARGHGVVRSGELTACPRLGLGRGPLEAAEVSLERRLGDRQDSPNGGQAG